MTDKSHPVFTPPDEPTTKIWRYMDFTKFVSMLENESLFFARADCLGDPFEGSYSRANEEIRRLMTEKYGIPPHIFEQRGTFVKSVSQWIMVNCWHMSEYESAAMWKLYAQTEEAICIQATYEQLRHCLPDHVYIGQVSYIDYKYDYIPEDNIFWPFIHKRRSFEHERELRAIKSGWTDLMHDVIKKNREPPEDGMWEKVNLDRLIEKIYVAPAAPFWFSDLVRTVVARYTLDKPVVQSSLNTEPFY